MKSQNSIFNQAKALETCCDAADRPRAERALHALYKVVGLAPPDYIVWCDSPHSLYMTYHMLQRLDETGTLCKPPKSCLWKHLDSGIRESVNRSIKSAIDASGLHSFSENEFGVHCAQCTSLYIYKEKRKTSNYMENCYPECHNGNDIFNTIFIQLGISLGILLNKADVINISKSSADRRALLKFIANSGLPARYYGFGQHDAHWLANEQNNENHKKHPQKLTALLEIARSAGWFLPFSKFCFISERPAQMTLGKQMRPHAADRPAIIYRDGWTIYAHHGKILEAGQM